MNSARIAEQLAVANRAPDQEPQHEAAVGVRRIDAVGDQERRRARMVGDDAPAHQLLGGLQRRLPDRRLRRDQVGEQVGLVHRDLAVRHGQHPLEPGAGIDRLARQLRELAVGAAVVLLENDVPDLDEPVAFVRAVVVRAGRVLRAGVVEDLAARAARAGRAHRPEVVFVPARDPRGVEPDLVLPQPRRFVVRGVHRDVQLRRIELHDGRQKLPSEADRLRLVVVAEREVPEHLEKRAVAAGAPDVLDVGLRARDAQAALHRDGARRRRGRVAQEHRDELLHPRDGEQRGAHLVGDERRGGQMHVPVPLEVVDERLTELLGCHDRRVRFATGRPAPRSARALIRALRRATRWRKSALNRRGPPGSS